jgi:hypothetical protein
MELHVRVILFLLLMVPAMTQAAEPSTLTPAMAPLQFLVGTWDASGGGKPGASAGTFTFDVQAGGHAILRRNASGTPEGHHDDVLLIDAEDSKIRAVYADSEGHVIHYDVTVADAKTVVFSSDPSKTQPAFRLSYHQNDDGSLATKFEIAPPGKTDYSTYLEGTAHRK